jgi:rSAM/selenodomain-associated transferase 2
MNVSVIIPALNEARCLASTIASVRRQCPQEIIVVDGGSADATRAEASTADRVLSSPRGRARQMNVGAGQARGEILLFLHADCTLEEGALAQAEATLTQGGSTAGCFQMCVTQPGLLYRSIDTCATLRVRLTGLVYGDQGLFLRRDLFERLGGFPEIGLMEDVFLSRKLRALGRIAVVPRKIYVSPRRWQKAGLLRQTLRNWMLTALAGAGIHPDRLAAFYPAIR